MSRQSYTISELTARVNQLYHKSQTEGLTEEEKKEQAELRRAYVANIRNNLKGQLNNISIVEQDGSISNVGERYAREKKKKLRSQALSARDAMTADDLKNKSDKIIQTLLAMDIYREAEAVLSYVNYKSEVITESLLTQALMDGKQVFVPRVSGQEMEFYKITDMQELSPGYQGIREPLSGLSFFAGKDNLCGQGKTPPLMILPGAAFDEERHRIGYGRGYYDKYLTKAKELQIPFRTVALCFASQMVPEIPCEAHDIRPDVLLTENGVYEEKNA
ncbi:MAG: 5-formyltetrahydrofolate cyclo-ligase [Blautia sp.]|nr:5-formyltetrahydrofolate cyclo-ligase [Lachnoclostridium sp.]MCM1210824.1 5-formyltetrahydrofolate cyclo-ligase [Blautia sp.]